MTAAPDHEQAQASPASPASSSLPPSAGAAPVPGASPPWRRRLVAAAAAALAFACGTAQAAPDAVARFLAEHGFTVGSDGNAGGETAPAPEAPATPGLIDQVRNTASDLVVAAMNFLGVPYRFGGDSEEEGFDCSGFTRHVFALALGLALPRRSDEQANAAGLIDIGADELAPGDLVFFHTLRRAFSHVGIYIGGGKFIHAPRTGGQVRIEDIRSSYWARRFDGARRVQTALMRRFSSAY